MQLSRQIQDNKGDFKNQARRVLKLPQYIIKYPEVNMTLSVIFIIISAILAVVVVIQLNRLVGFKHKERRLLRGITKERNATADLLKLSREVIASREKEREFLPYFIKYAIRSIKATGGALLLCGEDEYFYGCAVSGTFPPIKEVAAQIESQLLSHDKRHTEFIRGYRTKFKASDLKNSCGDRGFAYFQNTSPEWFPERFAKEAPRCLMAPIMLGEQIYGCIIVASKEDFDSHILSQNDGLFLIRLAEIASLCLEVIKDFRQRQEYEQQLQIAREEGMTQVSTGIIHNIGNAVTIAKLTANRLAEKILFAKEDRPAPLILGEILPRMKKELKAGQLEKFLKEDKIGQQYFDIMTELLSNIDENSTAASDMLKSLSDKLFHISEIIELQQQFVGELGTENMTKLSSVINSSITIFDESFNKRGFKINTDLKSEIPEVLIDPSMMTQVFINIIKNAVEAMAGENKSDKNYELKIKLTKETEDGKDYAVVEFSDNGPGIPKEIQDKIFEFGFSTKTQKNSSSRGIGLHFCLDCLKKYGGSILCKSQAGKGASFRVALPVRAETTAN